MEHLRYGWRVSEVPVSVEGDTVSRLPSVVGAFGLVSEGLVAFGRCGGFALGTRRSAPIPYTGLRFYIGTRLRDRQVNWRA